MTTHHAFHQHCGLLAEVGAGVLRPLNLRMHVMQVVLQGVETRLDGIWHLLLRRLCRRWSGRELGAGGERVSVDECVPRCSAFDLAQAYEIAALEVAVPVLELPEG